MAFCYLEQMDSILLCIPFVGFLLSIAILPLATPHFWDSNKNKGIIAAIFSAPILYLFLKNNPSEIVHSAKEYISFIFLLGSLFVISGGIAVKGDIKATPRVNILFLLIGAILANFIGTTGASMVLIRPFLKTNAERKFTKHLPIFFIFIVANCGGLLTPLGDPPLFLGYLRGVPFFWTLKLFPIWLLMNASLLFIFYIWDTREWRKEIQHSGRPLCQPGRGQSTSPTGSVNGDYKLSGKRNFIFLAGIIVAVFLPSPKRELAMLAMTFLSLISGAKHARISNNFKWHPIIEVAVLFAGIFITMVPALLYLQHHGAEFGITKPWQFFWTTGALSSFLDNAPTYLTFYSLAQGIGMSDALLRAISVGAVFMGANTYIGNGPNFMVKAIADHAGFKTPSFFHYMFYSACILVPLYFIITFLFFIKIT